MGKPRKKTQSRTPARAAAKGSTVADTGSPDDTGTGLTTPGYSDFDATDLNPQTCCSNCQTVFEVSLELLSSTDTRVRCGECLSIFDALANLRDMSSGDETLSLDDIDAGAGSDAAGSKPYQGTSNLPDASAAALAGLSNNTSSLDVTYSDFDLFSADAGLPEVSYFDQTQDTPGFDFNEVADEESDETFSDTLFSRDVTVDARSAVTKAPTQSQTLPGLALDNDVDYVTDDVAREALIFNYRERETLTPSSTAQASPYDSPDEPKVFTGVERGVNVSVDTASPWLLRSVLAGIILTLVGGLYMYRERDALVSNRSIRPVLDIACNFLRCTLPVQTDLLALKAVNRTVVSHPTLANALIIKFGILNGADFSQPYPVLEIRLEDLAGRLVVTNSFSPEDYTNNWEPGDVLDVGKRLDVALTVEDPGNTAMSFELDFRRARE